MLSRTGAWTSPPRPGLPVCGARRRRAVGVDEHTSTMQNAMLRTPAWWFSGTELEESGAHATIHTDCPRERGQPVLCLNSLTT